MKVLLVEDDFELSRSIESALKKEGYVIDCCHDGETAMLYALNREYDCDLAIIDRMLPVIDGLTIVRVMRQKNINIPVIIITGMSGLDDRIEGLDGGADDYLVKPFHIKELSARVRALSRRPAKIQDSELMTYGDLTFDKRNRQLKNTGSSLLLTAKETELLSVFMENPETLFSREQLIVRVWGASSDVEPGNVDNYISFLRKRLKELDSLLELKTVYGTGYKMEKKHD